MTKDKTHTPYMHIMDEFKAISFSALDDVLPCYTFIKHVIYTFNGDAERFFSYDYVQNNF